MSSVFEVPIQLALVLQLAAAAPATSTSSPDAPVVRIERVEHRGAARQLILAEERWLELLHEHGASAGVGHLASRIFRTRSGTLYVPVASERQALVAARHDPNVVMPVAKLAALDHAAVLSWSLGRRPTVVELALALVANRSEAVGLIEAAALQPQRPATELAPQAALRHPILFFDGARSRSSGEVVRRLTAALERADQRRAEDSSAWVQEVHAADAAAPLPGGWAALARKRTERVLLAGE